MEGAGALDFVGSGGSSGRARPESDTATCCQKGDILGPPISVPMRQIPVQQRPSSDDCDNSHRGLDFFSLRHTTLSPSQ